MYDSEGSDSEGEQEEQDKRERLAALHARLKLVPNFVPLPTCLKMWVGLCFKQSRSEITRGESLTKIGVYVQGY